MCGVHVGLDRALPEPAPFTNLHIYNVKMYHNNYYNTDDDNRVILTPMEDLSNDYINASYVDVSVSMLTRI